MATTVVAVVTKARGDVMSHFLSRDAVSPAQAEPYQPDRRIRRRMFEALQRAGVLKAGPKGGWYVDVPAWNSYSRKRRRRAGLMVAGTVAVLLGTAAIFA